MSAKTLLLSMSNEVIQLHYTQEMRGYYTNKRLGQACHGVILRLDHGSAGWFDRCTTNGTGTQERFRQWVFILVPCVRFKMSACTMVSSILKPLRFNLICHNLVSRNKNTYHHYRDQSHCDCKHRKGHNCCHSR